MVARISTIAPIYNSGAVLGYYSIKFKTWTYFEMEKFFWGRCNYPRLVLLPAKEFVMSLEFVYIHYYCFIPLSSTSRLLFIKI